MSAAKITIGADPEFFIKRTVKDVKDDVNPYKGARPSKVQISVEDMIRASEDVAHVVPICGILGGTKEAPKAFKPTFNNGHKVVTVDLEGFAHQEDGAAAEFNIPPATSVADFSDHVGNSVSHLSAHLAKIGYRPSRINSLSLKDEWVAKFPHLLQIGCDPDFVAYDVVDGVVEPRALDMTKIGNTRGAGGHIHIGYSPTLCPADILAKLMDLLVALPLLGYDKQGERRKHWGLAGLYRIKPYGMEYRTMSNWWIWESENRRHVACRVFALMSSIANNMVGWQALYNIVNWKKVQDIIYREDNNAGTKYFQEIRKGSLLIENFDQEVNHLHQDSTRYPTAKAEW